MHGFVVPYEVKIAGVIIGHATDEEAIDGSAYQFYNFEPIEAAKKAGFESCAALYIEPWNGEVIMYDNEGNVVGAPQHVMARFFAAYFYVGGTQA